MSPTDHVLIHTTLKLRPSYVTLQPYVVITIYSWRCPFGISWGCRRLKPDTRLVYLLQVNSFLFYPEDYSSQIHWNEYTYLESITRPTKPTRRLVSYSGAWDVTWWERPRSVRQRRSRKGRKEGSLTLRDHRGCLSIYHPVASDQRDPDRRSTEK